MYAIIFGLLACSNRADLPNGGQIGDVALLAPVRVYIDTGSYGAFVRAAPPAPWARGLAQQVQLTQGKFLFYVFENRVVGINRFYADSVVTLFREDIPAEPEPHYSRSATESLPAYSVVGGLTQIGGRRYGNILVPTLTRGTPADRREAILRAVLAREGFADGDLYCSKTAFLANMGEGSGGDRALKKCALGELRDGRFSSYDELY